MRRTVVGAALLLSVAIGLSLAVRIWHVHEQTWEWRLSPPPTPPKIIYADRDYLRASAVGRVYDGFVASGQTSGGATIYAPPIPGTPVVIEVAAGDQVLTYELMGGP